MTTIAILLALSSSASSQTAAPTPRDCKVELKDTLKLKPGMKYSRVTHRFDEQCKLQLSSELNLTEAPAGAMRPAEDRGIVKTTSLSRKSKPSAKATAAQTGCTVQVLEQDIIGVTMITLENGTTWLYGSGQIQSGTTHGTIYRNLDWWFVTSDPAVGVWWTNEPYAAESGVSGGFYCDGAGPIARYVCSGPSYQITMSGNVTFFGDGSCGGSYGYSGTVVPGGSVTASLTRN
jgi:hypothetical protein